MKSELSGIIKKLNTTIRRLDEQKYCFYLILNVLFYEYLRDGCHPATKI